MEWIHGLTKAIRFIEDNLTNNISVEDVSNQAFVSGSHFQRVFNVVTGITVSEYIRNRRLTLAGQDLLHTKIKVIDVAMRYQYDTSESFSKAFLRFHGISPSSVKKNADKIKCYRPLTINITIQGGFGMSRLILEDFDVPFSGFAGTSFINCFTSTYLFLENISGSAQERYFFFFDTMCGRSSLRCHYNNWLTPMQKMICDLDFYDGGSDNNIDFLFGLTGYEYHKLTEITEFNAAVASSIDAGRPVIAKVKTGKWRYRVITGYDDNALICPDYNGAQDKPEQVPAYEEIDALYIFGEKTKQRFIVLDGLKRIRQVMQYNISENLWGSYTDKLGTYKSYFDADMEERKKRMKRVAETMWHLFSCHNFRETFCFYDSRQDYNIPGAEQLKKAELAPLWAVIDGYPNSYNHTHDLAWGLIALESCADWSRNQHASSYLGPLAENAITQIAKNDAVVLDCIEKAITILEGEIE